MKEIIIQLKENRNINQINKKNKPMRNFFDFFSNNIGKRNINNKNNINNKKDKKQIILKNNIASLNLQRKQIGRNNININRLKTNTINKRSNNNEKIKERVKKIFDYIEQEKNTLEYNIALKQDKRNYCEYYQSLLKTQHDLIFSFFQSNDYNAKIIKIDLFFISFVIYYTINGLFFDDNTMHKIYENNGSFDIEFQISKIIYSSFISMFMNKILGVLALSNKEIIQFKGNKNKKGVDARKEKLEKKLSNRFTAYFILSFIFLIGFWYYIAMFGAIYRNTQFHLLNDTFISFGLSLIFPFFINLLPGFFRIPSLSNPKKNRKILYNFSKIIQMF